MRSSLAATLIVLAAAGSAAAQGSPPPATAASKPQPAAAAKARPGAAAVPDNGKALAERLALQSDLVWTGHFNGVINGEASERLAAAIKTFQRENGGKPSGVLTPPERALLTGAARTAQDNVGWRLITEPISGARLGVPTKLVPQHSADADGAKWSSSSGTIQVLLARRKDAAPNMAALAELEKKQPAGRTVQYSAVKPDFFVVSGMQGLKKFYVRGAFKDSEVRILTVLYDQATEGMMDPVAVAMSSAFMPFPSGVSASPPPRPKVEYATGVVVDGNGAILTDRQAVEGCMAIVVAGHGHADKVAEDHARDLALLRVYGATELQPLAPAGDVAANTDVEIVGIAAPQAQNGGGAVSHIRAQLLAARPGDEPLLAPAPGAGFAGAPALDRQGRFVGLAQLKPPQVAAAGAAAPQATLRGGDELREFLGRHGVAPQNIAAGHAEAALLRVICVRK